MPPTSSRTYSNLTPEAATQRLQALYEQSTAALAKAFNLYLRTRKVPSREERQQFCYPLLRIMYESLAQPPPISRRAFAKLQRPGVYETTVTHPEFFQGYLLEQLGPLVEEYGAQIEVTMSRQEIPFPYVLENTEAIAKAGVSSGDLARYFPTPNLAAVGDEIADGLVEVDGNGPNPLALFDAARTDYSLRRLVHYTGSDWRHTQRWVLLTNYHRYVDQFISHALEHLRSGMFNRLVMPALFAHVV